MVAIPVAAGLSPSATVMNTVPESGSRAPAAAWALANAVGKSRAIPITSPVERISGPSSASAPANRLNGSTASFTHTWPLVVSLRAGRGRRVARRAGSGRPAWPAAARSPWRRTAPFARPVGWPRSRAGPSSPWIANWTLSRPTTPSARAIPSVCSRICSSISSPSVCGGSTQAESPEWIPASSTCCMIPAIHTSLPSHSASTSTSIESSRKRSR